MKIIACCGYHATGSGVIDDLLREMDNVADAVYGAELRILHDTDCISDLEYHLVKDPHRLCTGLAIRRFVEYCKSQSRMEEKIFGKNWMRLVQDYADSLIINKYKGWIDADIPFMPIWKRRFAWLERAFFYVMRNKKIAPYVPKCLSRPRWYDYYPNYVTYYSHLTENDFMRKTHSFIENLCSLINVDNKEYLVLDQFVCPHNPMRDLKYVDDMKVIVVDRDPRDLYVHEMLNKSHVLPKDPKQFAVQYRLMRELSAPDDPTKVLRVKYEDMIFHYESMVPKVLDFLGIDSSHHKFPFKHFNPSVSINGTQLWIYKTHRFVNAVKIIENELPDMLYDYPNEAVRKSIVSRMDSKLAIKEYATKH